jgi:hypothetical protein
MKDASTRQRFLNNIERANIKIAHTAKVKELKDKSTIKSSGVRNLSKKNITRPLTYSEIDLQYK